MNADDVRKRARAHIIAFTMLLALALMAAATVLAGETNPAAVLGIAVVQVLIVVVAMMHALQEGPFVRWLLVFAVIFVCALEGLSYLGLHDTIDGTQRVVIAAPDPDAEPGDAD
jgi:heme/copper-type cytochrome/quinol oxidase subunit 4